ncbi:MAG: hypothetical protein ABII12_05650 [Planctomycetota bacterium]
MAVSSVSLPKYDDPPPFLEGRREAQTAAVLTLVGLAVSIAFGLASSQGIYHFDDLTHYLYAKWAWLWPAYLLDDWGRPGFTTMYWLPAGLGWGACRVLSAILTAASAWLAFRVARRIGVRNAWGVVPLAYAQPLFFQLSQTTLTETPLAFYLILAVFLAQRNRWSWSAAFISLCAVTRHEAIIFAPLWLFFAWRRRVNLWRLWPIVIAPLIVNCLAVFASTRPLVLRLLEPQPSAQYGHGSWLTFFARSMEAWGPGVTVLAVAGVCVLGRRRHGAIVAGCIVTYFAAQTIVRALGLFDSGGYARFLVPLSPLVAIAALIGWQRLWSSNPQERRTAVVVVAGAMLLLWLAMERQLALHARGLDEAANLPQLHRAVAAVRAAAVLLCILAIIIVSGGSTSERRPLRVAAVPAVVTLMILIATVGLCHPLAPPSAAAIVDDLVQWMADHGLADRQIITAHVWVDYAAGNELSPRRLSVRKRLENAPPGALFIWDGQFAPSADHKLDLNALRSRPDFRLIHETRPVPGRSSPYLRVFEKLPRGRLTELGGASP